MVTESVSNGRFKRIAQAARNADAMIGQVGDLTSGVSDMMVDVSEMLDKANGPLDRIDPALESVDAILCQARGELDAIMLMRRDVDGMLARVNGLLDLIEWIAAPAFATRARVIRTAESIRQARTAFAIRVRWEREQRVAAPVQPADLHLVAS